MGMASAQPEAGARRDREGYASGMGTSGTAHLRDAGGNERPKRTRIFPEAHFDVVAPSGWLEGVNYGLDRCVGLLFLVDVDHAHHGLAETLHKHAQVRLVLSAILPLDALDPPDTHTVAIEVAKLVLELHVG